MFGKMQYLIVIQNGIQIYVPEWMYEIKKYYNQIDNKDLKFSIIWNKINELIKIIIAAKLDKKKLLIRDLYKIYCIIKMNKLNNKFAIIIISNMKNQNYLKIIFNSNNFNKKIFMNSRYIIILMKSMKSIKMLNIVFYNHTFYKFAIYFNINEIHEIHENAAKHCLHHISE